MSRKTLPLLPADQMINEDVATLTSGIRTLAEDVGYKYAAIERTHRFRFLFDPMRLLAQDAQLLAYLDGNNAFPVSVELDPSNVCNHDCSFCIYHSMHSAERGERLETAALFRVIDELAELGCQSILFVGGGEPMTHPATVDAIERAAGHGMSVGLVTNGSRVFPEHAARLKQAATYVRFSLDAADPRLHARLHRNDDHHRIIANLRALAKADGPCTVGTGFFINEVNVGDILACGRLVKDCGADYIQYKSYSGVAIAPELHERMLRELAEAIELDDETFDVHIVDRIFDNAVHQVRGYSRCHWQAFKPVIGADGSVYLCAQKRTSTDGIIGNVTTASLSEIWHGEQRRQVLTELDLKRCPFCVHDRQNKLIEFLGSFTAPHRAFF